MRVCTSITIKVERSWSRLHRHVLLARGTKACTDKKGRERGVRGGAGGEGVCQGQAKGGLHQGGTKKNTCCRRTKKDTGTKTNKGPTNTRERTAPTGRRQRQRTPRGAGHTRQEEKHRKSQTKQTRQTKNPGLQTGGHVSASQLPPPAWRPHQDPPDHARGGVPGAAGRHAEPEKKNRPRAVQGHGGGGGRDEVKTHGV